MMNLFNLSAKLTLDTQDYEKNINKTVDDAEKKGNSIGDKLKSVASTTAKVFTGMVAGASTAIGFLVKNSIEEYAQYEQLVGGVETLFKDSSNKVMEYANNAYKSAGLSANEYMDTITSFSASLLQGLGGDTAKAAEIGNKAVIDMSDNAAKMGTSMELIQNAYSGFSKQNYTMLDNLKLGFGGTKEEMQRLLAEAQKLTGIEYKIENFSDIIEAIHVIQTEIGITGTTEKEAAATIEGSLNMTKSAWKNLMTGIADSNADFDVLITNMVDSTSAFGENILPRIEIALNGIGKLIEKLLPPIAEKIPAILIDILPKVFEAGVTIVTKLIEGVITNLPNLANTIKGMINEFAPALNPIVEGIEMLITNIDKIAGAVVVATSAIVAFKAVSAIQGIVGMWQEAQLQLALYSMSCQGASVAQGVMTGAFKASEIIVALFTGKLTLAELATIGFSKAQAALNAVLSANPIGLVIALVAALAAGFIYLWKTNEGFREAVIKAWEKIKEVSIEVWGAICDFFTNTIPEAWNSVVEFFKGIPEWFAELWNSVLEKFSEWGENIKNFFIELWENVMETLRGWGENIKNFFTETIPAVIESIVNWFGELPYKIGFALGELLGTIVQGWINIFNYFSTNIPLWIENIRNWFAELPGKIWNCLVTAYNKVVEWGSNTWNKFIEICTNVFNAVSEWFSQLPGKIWDCLVNAFNKITTWGTNTWNKAKEIGTNFINSIISFFSQLPGKIWNWLTNTIAKVSQFASDLGNKAREAGSNMVNNIINAVTGLPGKMMDIGKNIVRGVWNGITGLGSWLTKNVKNFFSGIVDGVKDTLGIKSPSRVFMEIGAYTSEGMAIGIEQNEDMVQKASENMVNTAIPDEIKVAETLNINRNAETSLINSLLSKLNSDKEIVLNIDGREFARATAEHMNNALNDYTNRYSFA